MIVLNLHSENVKRISAVDVKPDKPTVVIGGDNGNGKSSVVDSILYAMRGPKALPSEPVRHGEEKANIRLDLGSIVVERTFTSDGKNSVVVRAADGTPMKRPQEVLDELYSKFALDPLEFSRMKASEQVALLQRVAGVDFNAIDAKILRAEEQRKVARAQRDALEGAVKALPAVPTPKDIPDAKALMQQYQDAVATNQRNAASRNALELQIEDIRQRRAKIAEAEAQLESMRSDVDAKVEKAKELQAAVKALQDIDVDAISTELEGIQAIQEQAQKAKQRNEKVEEAKAARAAWQALENQIESLRAEKAKMLAGATIPVEGLSFDASGVRFNDVPFEQCSQAEQLRISLAMGIALNPKMRVLIIRDGSLLDDNSMKLVEEMAAAENAQVWIERVSKGEECTVIIEDGMVKP